VHGHSLTAALVRRALALFSLSALLAAGGMRAAGPQPAAAPQARPAPAPQAPAAAPAPVPARKPAEVMSYHGAEWLERPEREVDEKPGEVVRVMGLKDGDVVAEVGCGTGFFTRRLARAVAPTGKVYAEDIQPEMLALLERSAAREGITNIVPVLGTEVDPKLPRRTLRWILLADVYHELQKPREMLARIRDSLAPGGQVALVEFRLEGDTAAHIKPEHRMSVEQVLAEWNQAGFELVKRLETLPRQHLFIFTGRRGARVLP
jgi:predicted methyltransferase